MRGDQLIQTQLHMAQAFGALADLISGSSGYVFAPTAFNELPTAPIAGSVVCISDSAAASGVVTGGGGTNVVLALYNGTDWKVIGA